MIDMKRIMTILVVAGAVLTAASCDRYEDGRPSKNVRAEFERMYPDAWDVEWEYGGVHWEVEFETGTRPNGIEHTAFYDMDGNWLATKTELPLASVPQKIRDYLAASEYGGYRLEENTVDLYESPTETFYRFDLRTGTGAVEVDVTEKGEVSLAGYGF